MQDELTSIGLMRSTIGPDYELSLADLPLITGVSRRTWQRRRTTVPEWSAAFWTEPTTRQPRTTLARLRWAQNQLCAAASA